MVRSMQGNDVPLRSDDNRTVPLTKGDYRGASRYSAKGRDPSAYGTSPSKGEDSSVRLLGRWKSFSLNTTVFRSLDLCKP